MRSDLCTRMTISIGGSVDFFSPTLIRKDARRTKDRNRRVQQFKAAEPEARSRAGD